MAKHDLIIKNGTFFPVRIRQWVDREANVGKRLVIEVRENSSAEKPGLCIGARKGWFRDEIEDGCLSFWSSKLIYLVRNETDHGLRAAYSKRGQEHCLELLHYAGSIAALENRAEKKFSKVLLINDDLDVPITARGLGPLPCLEKCVESRHHFSPLILHAGIEDSDDPYINDHGFREVIKPGRGTYLPSNVRKSISGVRAADGIVVMLCVIGDVLEAHLTIGKAPRPHENRFWFWPAA